MFKYSTCTILNSLTDDNGVNKIVSTADALTIHRLGKFKKDNITKVYKRVGTVGTPGSAKVTCVTSNVPSKGTTQTAAGVYRLKIYVKLSGNNDAYYANDFVFKGKPYVYEFEVKESAKTAADVAKNAEAAINRLASRFNDKVFKVTVSGADVTLETVGKDNVYRNITECTLQKFDATLNTPLVGGEYVDVAEGVMTPCVNPFGTYGEIIKDLRLPTPEHTGWTSLMQDEMPVLGTVYTQYMIYMCVNRGIMGGDAVGEATKSITAHSIWVPSTMTTQFEGYLTTMGITPEDYKAEYAAALGDAADASDDVPGVTTEPDVTE